MEVQNFQEPVPVYCHFWDLNVQLQISYWKVSKVLNLRHRAEQAVWIISSQMCFCIQDRADETDSHLESEVKRRASNSRLLQWELWLDLIPSWIWMPFKVKKIKTRVAHIVTSSLHSNFTFWNLLFLQQNTVFSKFAVTEITRASQTLTGKKLKRNDKPCKQKVSFIFQRVIDIIKVICFVRFLSITVERPNAFKDHKREMYSCSYCWDDMIQCRNDLPSHKDRRYLNVKHLIQLRI